MILLKLYQKITSPVDSECHRLLLHNLTEGVEFRHHSFCTPEKTSNTDHYFT